MVRNTPATDEADDNQTRAGFRGRYMKPQQCDADEGEHVTVAYFESGEPDELTGTIYGRYSSGDLIVELEDADTYVRVGRDDIHKVRGHDDFDDDGARTSYVEVTAEAEESDESDGEDDDNPQDQDVTVRYDMLGAVHEGQDVTVRYDMLGDEHTHEIQTTVERVEQGILDNYSVIVALDDGREIEIHGITRTVKTAEQGNTIATDARVYVDDEQAESGDEPEIMTDGGRVFGAGENYNAHAQEGVQRECVECGTTIGNGTRCDEHRETCAECGMTISPETECDYCSICYGKADN